MTGPDLLVAVSAGLLVASVVFYVLAWRACSRALAALAEAREIHDGVDGILRKNLDTVARVEEFTC